jgi:hypothetical protein
MKTFSEKKKKTFYIKTNGVSLNGFLFYHIGDLCVLNLRNNFSKIRISYCGVHVITDFHEVGSHVDSCYSDCSNKY